jgi:hypothetical protein
MLLWSDCSRAWHGTALAARSVAAASAVASMTAASTVASATPAAVPAHVPSPGAAIAPS